MLRKSLVVLFLTVGAGAFAADPPASGEADTARQPQKLSQAFTVLHSVSQWATDLSQMADTKAKSKMVKDYAHEMAATNAEKDEKLMAIAKKHGIEVGPLDPQTEAGKSMIDRNKAEMVLLRSLDGDAFDKEYMTLVTNTQQSIIKYLEKQEVAAKEPDVKQLLGDMKTRVQKRLERAQKVMAEVYGDNV